MSRLALDPPVSEAQRRAMWAAREGHSTLGIPESVGKKFVGPGRDREHRQCEQFGNKEYCASEDETELKTKAEVDYEPKAKGKDCCRDCEHFDSPRACELVEGRISPVGWCKLFEAVNGGQDSIVFDRGSVSVREYDADGRLHVELTNISKANVCPYQGREIPNYKDLGLDANKIYKLLRHPDELKKAVDSFNGVQVLKKHVPVSAEDHKPYDTVGATGTDAVFEPPYLKNSLVVWAKDAIDDILSAEKKELSCAYRYTPDMTPGTYQGEAYDGVMRDIVANHVALVQTGRAGHDVMVGDEALDDTTIYDRFEQQFDQEFGHKEKVTMAHAAQSAVRGALAAHIIPRLAKNEKLDPSVLDGITSANFAEKLPELEKALAPKLAKDASIRGAGTILLALDEACPEPMKKGEDEWEDDDEEEKKKKKEAKDKKAKDEENMGVRGSEKTAKDEDDETEEERKERMKKRADDKKAKDAKRARDEEEDDKKKEKAMDERIQTEVKKGMKIASDEATRIQREIRDAERAVRPYVGELTIAFDSAEEVYRTALRAMPGVDQKAIDGVHASALKIILEMQPKPGTQVRNAGTSHLAQDSNGRNSFFEMFPDAAKIGNL